MAAFHMTEQLETIEFKDEDRAYCRKCDATEPMKKSGPSQVACMHCGTPQHSANLAVNGSHRRQPPTLRPEDMPADPPDVETNEYVVAAPVVLHPAYEYEMMAAI